MMLGNDLPALNCAILSGVFGEPAHEVREIVAEAKCVLACLAPTVEHLKDFFGSPSLPSPNSRETTRLNKMYLDYVWRESVLIVLGEKWDRLALSGMSLPQAAYLSTLSASHIQRLAQYWSGEIFLSRVRTVALGAAFPKAMKHLVAMGAISHSGGVSP